MFLSRLYALPLRSPVSSSKMHTKVLHRSFFDSFPLSNLNSTHLGEAIHALTLITPSSTPFTSPFSHMPTELIRDILLLCHHAIYVENLCRQTGDVHSMDFQRLAIVLSAVSRRWRSIALGIPELWLHTYIDFCRSDASHSCVTP